MCVFALSHTSLLRAESDALFELPLTLEIELALSALPAHLRDQATVYHLNPYYGYEKVRSGNNGFHTFVARTSPDIFLGSWTFEAYPRDLLIPMAFDHAGYSANMRPWFDIATMRASGVAALDAKQRIAQNFNTHVYTAPTRTGVWYMLSPILRAYDDPENSNIIGTAITIPHYMFYAPKLKNNAEIGGLLPPQSHPFLFRPGIHGVIGILSGQRETKTIKKEFKSLIKRVCKLNKVWCVDKEHK